MTGLTIAFAACWTVRGYLHAIQLASAFNKRTRPIPLSPT